MKLQITETLSLLMLKLYTHLLLTKQNYTELECLKLEVSAFTYLALRMFESNDILTTDWMIQTLRSYLSLEYPKTWPHLSSQMLLESVNDKVFLHLRGGSDKVLERMAEKLLMIPINAIKYISSNNVSVDEKYAFEISFDGFEEKNVLTYLTAVIHNAYNRSFFFPGLIDSSELVTVSLFGSTKNELLNPFNVPTFKTPKDIIIDVTYLIPQVSFKLVEWLKSTTNNRRIILIGKKENVSSLNVKVFDGLSVESYLVI